MHVNRKYVPQAESDMVEAPAGSLLQCQIRALEMSHRRDFDGASEMRVSSVAVWHF
jgi:hypothetical protein